MPTATNTAFQKRASSLGTYWTSTLSRPALRTHLKNQALTRFKCAEDGSGDQESSFEQAFSSLAYTYLKERAPRLLDFIVGFQLVDRNEDKTKAVGLFGFKVGDEWIYAPMFFLNGSLKGHELQYIKKQDAFVPLKENWVNFIISRKPHLLGEASAQNTQQLGGLMPNIQRFGQSPRQKYGADQAGTVNGRHIDAWARPALPLIASLLTKQAKALYPDMVKSAGALDFAKVAAAPLRAALAPTRDLFDMRSVLKDFGLLKLAYDQAYTRYPLIKQGFDRFYGPNFFQEMGQGIKAEMESTDLLKQAASYVLPPQRKPLRKRNPALLIDRADVLDEDAERKKRLKQGRLEIFVHNPITGGASLLDKRASDFKVDDNVVILQNKPELDDAEREKLLKDNILIRDERTVQERSTVYDTQVTTSLVNPDVTGLYDVLEKPGSFDKMLVITYPFTGRGHEKFSLVVRLSDPRSWLNINRCEVWTRQTTQPTDTEFKEWLAEQPSPESLDVGSTYVAIGARGSGTCPFKVKESYGDGAYKVAWEDFCAGEKDNDPTCNFKEHNPPRYVPWDNKLWLNRRGGVNSEMRSILGELWIPDGHKILKVKGPKPPKTDPGPLMAACCGDSATGDRHPKCPPQPPPPEACSEEPGTDPLPIQPGHLADIQLWLREKSASGELTTMRLHDVGAGEIFLKAHGKNERMSKQAALLALVRDHGLSESQSRVMLKTASDLAHRNGAIEYLIKYADEYSPQYAPEFPEPEYGTEQAGYNDYRAIYPQEEYQDVPGLDSSMTDPAIYDPFYMPDQQAMQQAQSAAQSGQKEVFDTSMVAGLLKSVRQDSLVDRYIGDLMKALDKLGRILFMFFWHQEEFADRYGKGDLPELEDSIRNAFEMLGDVCLYLKERTVQGGSGMDMDNGKSGPTDSSEPTIAETARN